MTQPMQETNWNGERCAALRGTLQIQAHGNNRIPVVLVEVHGSRERFYLDDRDGSGWLAVTDPNSRRSVQVVQGKYFEIGQPRPVLYATVTLADLEQPDRCLIEEVVDRIIPGSELGNFDTWAARRRYVAGEVAEVLQALAPVLRSRA